MIRVLTRRSGASLSNLYFRGRMKEIWIFQHEDWIGAGYLGEILKFHDIPHRYFSIEGGDCVPEQLNNDVAALVFLGGTMSVNDGLPWMEKELSLIRQADESNRPVLGHCLGSQLISRALGGHITKMPSKEIGWHRVVRENNVVAKKWFSGIKDKQTILIWHHDAFSVPPGASSLYQSDHCNCQAFAKGNILGTVAHIELNVETMKSWLQIYGHDIQPISQSVQQIEEISENLQGKMRVMHTLTNAFYRRWFKFVYPDLQLNLCIETPVDSSDV